MTTALPRTLAAALSVCAASVAHAGAHVDGWKGFVDPTIQDYGYQWSTVGHAKNADWVGSVAPFQTIRVGGVNHRYRIARTEVTNRQWFEFVQAYAPFVSSQYASSSQFTGNGVLLGSGGGYVLAEPYADYGAEVGIRYAMRYVNWLHNNKVNEAWAFESGVYDTSTFGNGPTPGTISDQRERSEGARYFLPTWDEWTKAAHFDPDRYGEGQEGYWLYTYTANTAPIGGAPGTPGAQTNAGTLLEVPILSYPDMQTPWGLWDASGSVSEWTATMVTDARKVESSNRQTVPGELVDRVSHSYGGSIVQLYGIRLGSVVPAPGPAAAVLVLGVFGLRRRSRLLSS